MSARGRRLARRSVGVQVETAEDVAAVVLRLAVSGCPHCGARAEFRPGPTGVRAAIDHRPRCPELTDPGHLAPTDHDQEEDHA